jgi:hypothetical protein
MGILTAVALIICGVLAAASLIAKMRPDSQAMIDKLVPYQGWIGFVVCIWGVWTIISSILGISLLHHYPILWVTIVATGAVEFGLGFLLGFGLITQYVLSSSPEAMAKSQLLRAKLATVQIPLGLIGIGLGVWCLLAVLVLYR